MRQYELTYLISDVVPESDLNKITGKIGGYISHLKGNVVKEEIWGRRKLAYPIKKQDFATYVTINFEIDPLTTAEFEREIRLTAEVLRHLLIVKEYEKEVLTLTTEEIAETEAIKEVVGSEKSFEAVEGETADSKDLMAVREEAVVEKTEEVKEATKTTEEVVVEAPTTEEIKEESKTTKEKPVKKEVVKKVKKAEKAEKAEDEADRLSKLNDELNDILKDDL